MAALSGVLVATAGAGGVGISRGGLVSWGLHRCDAPSSMLLNHNCSSVNVVKFISTFHRAVYWCQCLVAESHVVSSDCVLRLAYVRYQAVLSCLVRDS